MKLTELCCLLTEEEFSLLEEKFSSQLQKMLQRDVGGPLTSGIKKVRASATDKCAKTLKSWALEEIQSQKRHGGDISFAEKILNNCDKVAKQLTDAMYAKVTAPKSNPAPKKKEIRKSVRVAPVTMDDIDNFFNNLIKK